MEKLIIKKRNPSPKIVSFIDTYWIIKNNTKDTIHIPIVPDGCMDIIYYNSELIFAGATDEGIIIDVKPKDCFFGIRFKPAIFPHLLEQNYKKLTNEVIPLENISKELFELLNFEQEDENKKVEQLNTIFEKLFESIKVNKTIIIAVEQILEYKGDISIGEVSEMLGISQRQLERLFSLYLGYSPKKFSNIIRFFYIYKSLVKTGTKDLISKAYEFGYCDQAHFNKEFKKFSNFTPTDEIMSVFYNT